MKIHLQKIRIQVLEKGVEYQQDVDLDEEDHLITVHVPAHSDVEETYFITDTIKVNSKYNLKMYYIFFYYSHSCLEYFL